MLALSAVKTKPERTGKDARMSLQAGVAVEDITPRKPMFLVGYPHVDRISTGVHDPLLATALCLEDSGRRLLSVALDILFIHHETARACRARIGEVTGITPECIMITATHTHSGPITSEMLCWGEDPCVPGPDTDYMQMFQDAIVKAAVAASGSLRPARIATVSTTVDGVGGNRLAVDGVRDPEVGGLYLLDRAAGTPLALQMFYAMHPTVLHEDSTLVSADFPAFTRRQLTTNLPELTVLYHTGPSGNLSPRYHVTGQTFAEAERLGRRLGNAVLAGIRALKPDDFADTAVLAGAAAPVALPPRRFPAVAEAEIELFEAVAEFERLKRENAGHGPVRTAECTVFGAEERVVLAKAQEHGHTETVLEQYSPAEIQAFRVNDVCLAALPGECFVEYALEIKRRAPCKTFVASLANGELQGYIPTPDATGYEARLSFFEPRAGELMVDALLAQIATLTAAG